VSAAGALDPAHDGIAPVDTTEVTSGLRMRILLPLAAALLVLVTAIGLLMVVARGQHMREQASDTARSMNSLLQELMGQEVRVMQTVQGMLMDDPRVRQAYLARDRQALLSLTGGLLQELKKRHAITHIYFITPDRRVLLRTHEPGHAGDLIDRYVMLQAQQTGRPAAGNEQGTNGAFTLRVSAPWYVDGKLVGYIELGAELEDLFVAITKVVDGQVLLLLNKQFLEEAPYRDYQKRRGQPQGWDEFRDVLVLSRTTHEIPPAVRAYLASPRGPEGTQEPHLFHDAGRTTQVVEEPLSNSRGQKVGSLLVMTDVTGLARMWNLAISGVVLAFALIGGILTYVFHRLLTRVQQDVAARSARLNRAQAGLFTEQAQRQRAQRELAVQQERNQLLEARSRMVEELEAAKRTVEAALRDHQEITETLRETQGELVAAARQAGRAEIATNVLHNVGNVLNSVNTSASVIGAALRKSRLGGLRRALDMLREQGENAGRFLAEDAKGRMLPGYLAAAAQALDEEHREMNTELDRLVKSVDHVKDIVATQQSHAVGGEVSEPVAPVELVEEALRMQGSALARHQVQVIREYEPVPTVPLDRGRILQILINLISNAKHAMGGVPEGRQRLTVRIEQPTPATLRISVKDEGEGISAENLTRIFSHGFTTRVGGHGFGLHSSALAAHEMGGTLGVASDGPGRGATFTLELPIGPAPGA
jgi:signal transduction histidine kinase